MSNIAVASKFAITDNTTWLGKDTLGFYSKALLEGGSKSQIKLVADVKSKVKLARVDITNILQSQDCTFTDAGSTTLGQKTLTVCPIKVNVEFCTKDFEVNYLSEQLKPGSLDSQLPTSFQDYILGQMAKSINAGVEFNLWQGDPDGSPVVGLCDGFLALFADESPATVLSVSGTTLSATNIVAEIAKVYAKIPATIVYKGNVKIWFSVAASQFYKQALAATFPALIALNKGDFELSYIDIPLMAAPGMPTNVMVAAEPDNLWYGTDFVNDVEDIIMIPMRDKTGEPKIRFACEFKMGFQFGVGEEIVWYH